MQAEEWRPVAGYEGYYEVSNLGRIRSLARNGRPTMVKKLTIKNKFGHRVVTLCVGGEKTIKNVGPLVLTAFVGPRPEGLVTCHNDGDPANNRVSNLRWDTQSNNLFDAVAHGTHPLSAATHCGRGHEFTPTNTYRCRNGWRRCKQCTLDRVAAKKGVPSRLPVQHRPEIAIGGHR